MRIAIVASPFIPVPPMGYGGTELFVATLAEALAAQGVDVVVYANGESTVQAPVRWRYAESDWPLTTETAGILKEMDHLAWALDDAAQDCDIIHINGATAVPLSHHVRRPTVCTLHHPYEAACSDLYMRYPEVSYVTISKDQASLYPSLKTRTIHHGIDLDRYNLRVEKDGYLSFLGRIAPLKGVHTAIQVAKLSGIPLKIAGEVQPVFQDYYDAEVKPHIDGRLIEYVGEADLAVKNELLGGSIGMVFPIEWEEPFGLVMIEAMACGTPVFGFRRGAAPEVICEGISGSLSTSAESMAKSVQTMRFDPNLVRHWVVQGFSAEVMASRYLALYRNLMQQNQTTGRRGAAAGEILA